MSESFMDATLTPSLVSEYYGQIAKEDVAAYRPDELQSRVAAHLEIGYQREADTANVAITGHAGVSVVNIVTDDMPFLVDSVTAALVQLKAPIQLVVHPTFVVARDRANGEISQLSFTGTQHVASGDTAALADLSTLTSTNSLTKVESWISVELARELNDAQAEEIISTLHKVLNDVRVAVTDWAAMLDQAREIAQSLPQTANAGEIAELDQAVQLLEWMADDKFTFLGYRQYDLQTVNGEDVLVPNEGTGLGLMRDLENQGPQHLTKRGRITARDKRALIVTKANSRSTVHRGVYLDYVGVKSFDANGEVNGERRFIGLFSSSMYTSSVDTVPVAREKAAAVLKSTGFAPNSHSGKDITTILETYPRDEMFQISVEDLTEAALGILRLQERRRTSVFLRTDDYGRFVTAMVYIPRDRFSTAVRYRVEQELQNTFNAESVEYEAQLGSGSLVRLFYRLRLQRHGLAPVVDRKALEDRIATAVRSWSEAIVDTARANLELGEANSLTSMWAEAFPASYKVQFEIDDALSDIELLAELDEESAAHGPVVSFYNPRTDDEDALVSKRMKIYVDRPLLLSRILPVLQDLGLEVVDERPYELNPEGIGQRFIYDMGLKVDESIDFDAVQDKLAAAYAAVVRNAAESDKLNALVLREGLDWEEVAMLRGYAHYLLQLGVPNSTGFIANALVNNADVTHGIVALFHATFDPQLSAEQSEASRAAAHEQIAQALEAVPTLDADTLLRRIVKVIEATKRTNYYAQGHQALAFKLAPEEIDFAPFPRPKHELWVYSPRIEGTHFRFGAVARGGLRWSDRREDFRTEVLGLVKAQMVKNSVIVPTGAKGGFYAKQLPNPAVDRGAWMEEGKAAYRIFIRTLLELTDNLVADENGEHVESPKNVVRRDGDDTYLVVAADKGTASFSDIANSISEEKGHWLGDAFASGGSVGYDHKGMGITARGAWESVKRHFFELGIDTQSEEFTAVGVGDMSGDVFGNGLRRTKTVKLVAAFDHRDIFLDPNPNPAVAFDERERLYFTPRSSWADYNPELISAGGGVYSRSLKSVPVSPEVREVLGLDASVTAMSPNELLKAILSAPVDLLYNGGIGTYVKSSAETNGQVGDRANDAIRVDGADLRVKVVGEGGNLGMTQLGRIEAARKGVLLNTDAIDNSAGVDTSDREVNIKIFVDRQIKAGNIDPAERKDFLLAMTDTVGDLVLQTNFNQNVLLLNEKHAALTWAPAYERLMQWLEEHADLNRALEFLPTAEQLDERRAAGEAMTAPELSVLAAYAKIQLAHALTESDLAEDPYFAKTMHRYFPPRLVERFGTQLQSHPLRKEIIATVIANDVVNIGGITYVFRAMEETGASELQIAKVFCALREVYRFDAQFEAINAQPAGTDVEYWGRQHHDMRRLLDRATRWFINRVDQELLVSQAVERYEAIVTQLREELPSLLRGNDQERFQQWHADAMEKGIGERRASMWASQFESYALLDVADLVQRRQDDVAKVSETYFVLYDMFQVDNLLNRITNLPRSDRWQALARAAMRDDLYTTIIDMTANVLDVEGEFATADERVAAWEEANAANLDRAKAMFAEVNSLERDDMASLSVALRLLRSIVRR
ncbi:NAD-glutamate dehydrogenase [Glutamicibacter uratoxydans]|uniref:NAD-glutamate dehydrogenase n=1 Tax=Glutamicibacter uratoxydans TaxID=43667 RepID=A0A4Y4DQZ9_GLUUR|nr:NAD-glutamate dehydrogenase [Glutamicibacter uratoxydans]GED07063.1 NAD-glutamate dehydrogenase [Glutamicibacter uratoxydans]